MNASQRDDDQRLLQALQDTALVVSRLSGPSIFLELTEHLARSLGTSQAMIGQLSAPDQMTTLAVYYHGKHRTNFVYTLTNTPCLDVIEQGIPQIRHGLLDEYPENDLARRYGFNSYAAYPLYSAQGQALGLVALMDEDSLAELELLEPLLKIVAVRAAAELERMQTATARRALETSYREIFQAIEDAVFVHDLETGRILDCNDKACETYGYSRDEIQQIDVGAISSGQSPYTLQHALKYIERAKAGETVRFEWHRKNKDDSLHWDEVVLKRAALSGQDRILAFTRDISERKQAEQALKANELQLRQAQKMEALGHLTGGIAHDFNNILTSIMGYTMLASENADALQDQRLQNYLQQIQKAGARAQDLIQQLLTFSRGQRGERQPLALSTLIEESVKLFSSTFPSTLEFFTSIDRSATRVMFDPIQLEQILMNLCINARDAMQGHGLITLRVSERSMVDGVCASCRQTISGVFVELAVADTGPGIESNLLERIFEPFVSTKETGKSSGMGLATVHGIVHEHGGHIDIRTVLGQGTEFRVLLPPLSVSDTATTKPVVQRQDMPADLRFYGHILVVEDEPSITDFMRDLLSSRGFQVTTARNGRDALAIFQSDPENYDLVITDQTMPKLTGLALARELFNLRPQLPVILYTGYSENLSEQVVLEAGIQGYLKKPLDIEKFFSTIKQALGRRS